MRPGEEWLELPARSGPVLVRARDIAAVRCAHDDALKAMLVLSSGHEVVLEMRTVAAIRLVIETTTGMRRSERADA